MKTKHNISQELLETVEGYLNGTLPPADRERLEAQIKADPDFALQVEDIKTLLAGIETAVMKEKMEAFHKEASSKDGMVQLPAANYKKSNFRIYIGIAATLVALLGIFWFFTLEDPHQKLYSSYYSPDPGLPTTMSSSLEYDFYNGMVSYKQGHYDAALQKWEPLFKTNPTNDTLNYFMGSAHLALDNDAKAASFLEDVSNNNQSMFNSDALYYLGLIHLKKGNIENAKNMLQQSHTEKAEALLKEINREL
tara:strand:- start:15801 stop:16553 length:753 start_codon:yes stop_codon:yes gene_type:complete